jgi:hypothetical protein
MCTYLQIVGDLLQTSFQRLAALHKVFDVVYTGKVCFEEVEKVVLFGGECVAGEKFQEIAKIVSAAVVKFKVRLKHRDGKRCKRNPNL